MCEHEKWARVDGPSLWFPAFSEAQLAKMRVVLNEMNAIFKVGVEWQEIAFLRSHIFLLSERWDWNYQSITCWAIAVVHCLFGVVVVLVRIAYDKKLYSCFHSFSKGWRFVSLNSPYYLASLTGERAQGIMRPFKPTLIAPCRHPSSPTPRPTARTSRRTARATVETCCTCRSATSAAVSSSNPPPSELLWSSNFSLF